MLLTYSARLRVAALILLSTGSTGISAQETESEFNWIAHGRTRFESAANSVFGTRSKGERALYQRLHVGAQWRNSVVEAKFTIGLHAQQGLDDPGPRDRGPGDFQDAYLGFHLAGGLVNARVGRQGIRFGRKRFVDTGNSSNVRTAYDGIDLSLDRVHRQLRLFVVQPVLNEGHSFDDGADDRLRLAVLQGTIDNRADNGSLWELYGLRFRTDRGAERDIRRALGVRQVGIWLGWDTDIDLQLQRGEVGDRDARAYALGAYASRPLTWSGWDQSKLYVQLDLASGDDPNTSRVERFNPILPSRSTFSQAGYTGYANLRHFKVGAEVQKGRWKSSTAIGLMQRMRTDDAVFAHASRALPDSENASAARTSGVYLQFKAERSLWKNAKAYTEWVYLDAGEAISAAGGSDQLYFAFSFEWNFKH